MKKIIVPKIGKSYKSTDPNDFVFHSDYNSFKIVKTGELDITVVASTSNVNFTVAHGLDFTPLTTALALEVGVNQAIAPNSRNVTSANSRGTIDSGLKFNSIAADATNVIANFSNSSGSNKSVKVRYFCLEAI